MKLNVSGIDVEVTKKKMKTMRLSVSSKDGSVRVSAPKWVDNAMVERFVNSKIDWINKYRQRAFEKEEVSLSFENGENVKLLGKSYLLSVIDDGDFPDAYTDGRYLFLIFTDKSSKEERKSALDAFYHEELEKQLEYFVPKWENITGLKSSGWKIRDMKTRWGSCTPKSGTMRFNLQLATKDAKYIEYVVLHEITHLKIHNHGADFKAFLDSYMPMWRELKKELNEK